MAGKTIVDGSFHLFNADAPMGKVANTSYLEMILHVPNALVRNLAPLEEGHQVGVSQAMTSNGAKALRSRRESRRRVARSG